MKRRCVSAAWACLVFLLAASLAAWQQPPTKGQNPGSRPSVVDGRSHLIDSSDVRAAAQAGSVDIDSTALLMKMLSGPSDPSLEMRENVDFLATPAMAVMQACSTDAVITYPSE